MTEYLIFRLYGPLCSWGDIAVGERRATLPQPTKSAVLGLAAAALGLRREAEAELKSFHGGYGYACRVDAPGRLMSDYHTTQSTPQSLLKKRRVLTRREELDVARGQASTILSSRDYIQDGVYRAALWAYADAPLGLNDIRAALMRPVFSLFLGRRSCPPALPLHPQIVAAGSPTEALRDARFPDAEMLAPLLQPERQSARYHWEGEAAHLEPLESVRRRDVLHHRGQWQYIERIEHIGMEGIDDVDLTD